MSVPRRPRSRRGEGEGLRESILVAAADLLDAGTDVETLSVRTVTAAAGVSPTALYLHFDDKAALVHAVKLRCLTELAESLRAARDAHDDAHGGTPADRLRAMGAAYLDYATRHPGHYAMLYHAGGADAGPDGGPPDDIQKISMDGLAMLAGVVAEGIGGGTGNEAEEAYGVAFDLWLSLHGRAHIAAAMPWFPLPERDEYIDRLAGAALHREAPHRGEGPR